MFNSQDAFWTFQYSVRRKARYVFDDETRQFLDEVASTSKCRARKLKHGTVLFRAQRGASSRFDEQYGIKIPEAHEPSRMSPLPDCATEGRINPKGIPCLYLAFDPNTAMAEVRPRVGAKLSMAEFVVTSECTIVDCSIDHGDATRYIVDESSYFPSARTDKLSAEECERVVWGDIARHFSEPANNADTIAEYAVTQILSELFRHEGYAGIAYKSALNEKGKNVALFDLHAAELRSCALFETRAVAYQFDQLTHPYRIPKFYPDLSGSIGLDITSDRASQPPYLTIQYFPKESESSEQRGDGAAPDGSTSSR